MDKNIIIKGINETLYRLFKMKCAENGITIKAALIGYMAAYTDRKADKKEVGK